MSKIGTITGAIGHPDTPSSLFDIPVYELSDFETTVHNNLRTSIDGEMGAIPITDDTTEAQFPSFKTYIDEHGVCSFHDNPFISYEVDAFENGIDHYTYSSDDESVTTESFSYSGFYSVRLDDDGGIGDSSIFLEYDPDQSNELDHHPQAGRTWQSFIFFDDDQERTVIYRWNTNLQSGSGRELIELNVNQNSILVRERYGSDIHDHIDTNINLNSNTWYEVRIRFSDNDDYHHSVEILDSGDSIFADDFTQNNNFSNNKFSFGCSRFEDGVAYIDNMNLI